MANPLIQQTLVLLKPDAMQRGLMGEIMSRFERVGLKIVGAKMMQPSRDHYHHHYEDIGKMISRRGQRAFDVTLGLMEQGPVLALVLQGIEAVMIVRKMAGVTEPKAAQPGTIRGDYAHIGFDYANPENVPIPNLVHASGDVDEAKEEIAHWFSKEEIFDYQTTYEKFTQVSK